MKKKRSLTTFILPSRCLLFSPSNNPPTTALTMQCSSIKCSFTLCLLPLQSLSSPTSAVTQHQLAQPVLESSLTICGRWQEARQLRGRRGEVHPATPCAPHTSQYPCTPLLPSLSPSLATHIDRVKGDRSPTRQGEEGKDISKAGLRGNPYPKVFCCPSRPFHGGIR